MLTGEADPERAARALATGREAVVKLGAEGALWSDGERVLRCPAGSADVVDTTGAGDAFTAGLLATLAPRFAQGARPADLDEDELRHACARGNALGARAVTQMGATAGLPRRV